MLRYSLSSELIVNGNFDRSNFGWQFECQEDPLQHNASSKDNYVLMIPPCQIMQCPSGGGYLKMQVSSPDLNVTFDRNFVDGEVVDGYYQGWVTCRRRDGCCLVIAVKNNSVSIDDISLDDKVEEERSGDRDLIQEDVKIVIIIIVLLVFCICTCACCHQLVKNRIDSPDREMHEVTRRV